VLLSICLRLGYIFCELLSVQAFLTIHHLTCLTLCATDLQSYSMVLSSQITFIFIVYYTIEIGSKQLHNNKQESKRMFNVQFNNGVAVKSLILTNIKCL